jgi:hypothetical protein
MSQALQGATFHIEHIIPLAHGGLTEISNLALACPSCNLHKADRVSVVDSDTAVETQLFHPRIDLWTAHFEWDGYLVCGKTPTGRVTTNALQLNHHRRLLIREAEAGFGLYPPHR